MNYDRYEAIEVSREGRKLTLTLSNPGALNAVTARMHSELSTVFIDVGAHECRSRSQAGHRPHLT